MVSDAGCSARKQAAARFREQTESISAGEMQVSQRVDVVIVGGGHNGLVAACLLARAGLDVVVFERARETGGAAVSAEIFPGVPARVSKYAYLLSLMPRWLMHDLGLQVEVVRRRVSSYTPCPTDPARGLAVVEDPFSLAEQFAAATGDAAEAERWQAFYHRTARMAKAVFPTLTEPLRTAAEMQALCEPSDWHDFVERPLGEVIESSLKTDLARGVVATDALIGTFADLHDRSLRQNICFLYHVIGNGTGDWDLPVGGMGAVTQQLAARARQYGARIVTSARVTAIDADEQVAAVRVEIDGNEQLVQAGYVLANCPPAVLQRLQGRRPTPPTGDATGAQLKVNMVLQRLPQLRDTRVGVREAFCGTFHVNEGYGQLQRAVGQARLGRLPSPLPAEIYCHSLSDPSILGPELRAAGAQTLTMFVLHTPYELFTGATPPSRMELRAAVLQTLDSVLAEPLEDCLLRDSQGRECLEISTPLDLEQSLEIPTGNIFHTPLEWPWATTASEAGQWGVETDQPRVVLCGSGAKRGGGVSGVPGHNAARYVLGSS
jgi:phytoene dehydrogenase-like protein